MTDETPAPKRRGRPPGSKNKPKDPAAPKPVRTRNPKPVPVTAPAQAVEHEERPAPAAVLTLPDNVTPAEVERIRTAWGSGENIPVVIQGGGGLSTQTTDREVPWPAEWPLPHVGDAIMDSKRTGGRVMSIRFQVDERKIYILLDR